MFKSDTPVFFQGFYALLVSFRCIHFSTGNLFYFCDSLECLSSVRDLDC
jgi:hypothetical protein